MATKKEKVSADEKFEKQDFNLFEALAALDRKDYNYLDTLTEDQQRKFVPFMMTQWMSAIKGSGEVQGYYLRSVDYHANIHLFNETIAKNPKLQWMMLCASSPGLGKQFHQWIPNISIGVSKLKSPAKAKEVKEYYSKVYPKVDDETLQEITTEFVAQHKRKMHLSQLFPELKLADIEVLNQITTDGEIAQYEKDRGN